MTKKKSIWTLVLAFCLAIPAIIIMTACGGGKDPEENVHEHTYSAEWNTNSTHHWHDATCEH